MTKSDPLDELLDRLSSESNRTPPRGAPTGRRARRVRQLAHSTGAVPVLEDEACAKSIQSTPCIPGEDTLPEPPPPPEDPGPMLFSERHPAAYGLSRLVLPRLPVLAIVVPICILMVLNLLKGDYLFILRWYDNSIVFPWLVQMTTVKGSLQEWWAVWGPFTVLIIATIVIALVAFYMTAWRYMFKDYTRHSEGVETREGRCYWLEGGGFWFILWDGVYGKLWTRRHGQPYEPKRKHVTAYIRDRMWPPINLASPGRKMLKIHLSPSEPVEKRGPFELVAHERMYRRIVGIREFETHDDAYTSAPLPTEWGKALFKTRIGELVNDTQTLTKANVGVRLDKMKAGTIILDEELKDMILQERQQETMLNERRKENTGA